MSLVRVQSEEPNLGKQTFTDVCFLHLYQLINPFFRFTLVLLKTTRSYTLLLVKLVRFAFYQHAEGTVMSLTDTKVKNSQTSGKRPSSSLTGLASIDSKYWQSGYRFDGKQKVFSIGVYLAISLADARQRRDEAKRLLAQGIDPNAKNRLMKKSFRKSAIKPARPVSSPKADAP